MRGSEMHGSDVVKFDHGFRRLARRIRIRLGIAALLTGATAGATGALAVAAGLWWAGYGEWRWASLACIALGLIGGAVWTHRHRLSDQAVALILDARLGAAELISTAVGLRESVRTLGLSEPPSSEPPSSEPPSSEPPSSEPPRASAPAAATIFRQASEAMARGESRRLRLRMLRWQHLVAVGATGTAVWLSLLPARARSGSPTDEADNRVQIEGLTELDAAELLGTVEARTPGQKRRLKELAERAKKLRAELEQGLDRQEAQARLATLRDDIASERALDTSTEGRAGLEAAIDALQKNRSLSDAARALGNGDLADFDRKMHELANRIEAGDREQAKEALEAATEAARAAGNRELAQALEEQQELFERRIARADALRELARAMGGKLSEDGRQALEEFERSGDPDAARRLAEAMEQALQHMTPAEREKLAENLSSMLESGQGKGRALSEEELREWIEYLESPEGQRALQKRLEDLARGELSPEAQRQRRFGDAERGLADAERRLRGMLPVPTPGSPATPGQQSGQQQPGQQPGQQSDGSGTPNSGGDGDSQAGDHSGQTERVDGSDLRAKADTRMLPGAPMHGATLGRAPGGRAETADQAGEGTLRSVGPVEVGAVERSDVPEQYREQVGRYFQP